MTSAKQVSIGPLEAELEYGSVSWSPEPRISKHTFDGFPPSIRITLGLSLSTGGKGGSMPVSNRASRFSLELAEIAITFGIGSTASQ